MYKRLTAYFQERAERKEFDRRLAKAIQDGHEDTVHVMAHDAQGTKFREEGRHYKFLEQVLQKDNLNIFNSMFGDIDPNYKIYNRMASKGGGFSMSAEKSLLYAAIDYGSENIALTLAENPDVDIEVSGKRVTNRYDTSFLGSSRKYSETETYDSPLELARKKDMQEVASVLAGRTADILSYQVEKLRREELLRPIMPM